ncbi:unnamed protein product [Pleuronectes platessa]|uniref:Uncharacterized protein n=1 Tax=Pleuronectes platessa TaxID=8262 RepID=A0A9N7TZQ4_PLEPL|nr:unnamed protein product [Pleuronectes platessa]
MVPRNLLLLVFLGLGRVLLGVPLPNHAAPSVANKEKQAPKPKREVDSVYNKEVTPHTLATDKESNQDVKKVRNNTKNAEKTGRSEKAFTIHHKPDLHSNKTRFKSGSRSRVRPDLSVYTTGVPRKGFSIDSNRKLNLTGSYGLLKLLSKENLVRIVNSQMQSVPSLSFPSKGSRSRKRDLIDVNHRQLEAQKVARQDMAVTQSHTGFDNQTAFPYVSPVTTPDLNRDPGADIRINPLSEVKPALKLSTAQYPADEDNTPVNSSHVLRLHPAPEWSYKAKNPGTQAADPKNGQGLVFEEAESEVKEEVHERMEGKGSRSRSRRSWIWNQFFVIEEYAGPEPVLIGRSEQPSVEEVTLTGQKVSPSRALLLEATEEDVGVCGCSELDWWL